MRTDPVPQYVETSAGRIHALVAGEGAPLVLLPHGGRSSQMYRNVLPLLAEHSRVIALDPPGSGGSYRPSYPMPLQDFAHPLHEAATILAGGRYMLYGMNGGNKLAAAIAASHPDAVTGLIFAGLTHSIVLSNHEREQTLGQHPMVRALVDPARQHEDSLRSQAHDAVVFTADRPVSDGIEETIDRLRSVLYRQPFYEAVLEFDLESALRALTVPLAILEFATPEEDATIGRQGAAVANELGARAHAVLALPSGAAVSLEDRAPELARSILALRDSLLSAG